MPPMSIPEKTSCPKVVIRGKMPAEATVSAGRQGGSALGPWRQRHHVRLRGGERRRIHLFVAALGPLPHADRGAQILTGVLGVLRPVEIGELDAATVDQGAFRQVELECD